jgi:RNA polymerase sigma-70 factor (ECF subfamily)
LKRCADVTSLSLLLELRELSLKEASALTGMSIGALKIATHRALASLRRALQGTDDE